MLREVTHLIHQAKVTCKITATLVISSALSTEKIPLDGDICAGEEGPMAVSRLLDMQLDFPRTTNGGFKSGADSPEDSAPRCGCT